MRPLRDKRILLGVGGSIAAYKACELARALMREGAIVTVAPTRSATRFVGPLTFEGLTGRPCLVDVLDTEEGQIPHVEEAYRADLAVVAPASANLLARMAQGFADEALLATLLSVRSPLLIAPAMETRMWQHPATQQNVELLRSRGAIFVEPAKGALASGRDGEGRLAPVEDIVEACCRALTEPDLERRHVLITAGPTAEDLDPVRYLTNRSSGKMGFALAVAASRRGARVTLIHGPTTAPVPAAHGVDAIAVRSAADMHDAVMDRLQSAPVDVAILAAAVADYRPAAVAAQKIKKTDVSFALPLERTPDNLAAVGDLEERPLLVGFAAETQDLLENARLKLERKNCDVICANDVSVPGLGFDTPDNRLTLLLRGGTTIDLGQGSKVGLAHGVLNTVVELLRHRSRPAAR
ncbi:MAG: bifunctional phosphopantothenoylcysteine decarboxylase/phosphopantothenate--cysteine ligase CoaBC [Myxococcota bacterium]